MAEVKDVAAYIKEKFQGQDFDAYKLQKLLYYCQGWALAWNDEPLFPTKLEAWRNGPVAREVWNEMKFDLSRELNGDGNQLSEEQRQLIDYVTDFYGKKSGSWLSNLSHKELPWINARKGLDDYESSDNEVSVEDMVKYFKMFKLKPLSFTKEFKENQELIIASPSPRRYTNEDIQPIENLESWLKGKNHSWLTQ